MICSLILSVDNSRLTPLVMYIYSSLSPFILSPLVEWYVGDIDKS